MSDTSYLAGLSMAGRIAAFDKRHGGKENSVLFNSWIYYKDGASRDYLPEGALIEPPKDDYQRLLKIVYYNRGRLAEATRQFEDLKAKLSMAPCPQREGLEELKKLQHLVSQRSKECQDTEAALAETPEGQQRARGKQQD